MFTALTAVLSAQSGSPESLDSAEAYENQARLPVDLYTPDGTLLAAGAYRVRVQFDEGRPSLLLTNSEDATTAVQGRPAVARDSGTAPTIPIAGTLFLRSTEDPVGTDAERHRSKTGHAQYHETKRDWKAALRMYRYADAGRKEVLLLFQRRQPQGLWETSEFQLFLQRP